MESVQKHIANIIDSLVDFPQQVMDNAELAATIMSLSLPTGKIICIGSPLCQPILHIFSQRLNMAYAFKTRTINATCLNTDASRISYLYPALGIEEGIKVEFSMTAHAGDSIFLISQNKEESMNLTTTIKAAHELNIPIIAVACSIDSEIHNMMIDNDLLMNLSTKNNDEFLELSLVISNAMLNMLVSDDSGIDLNSANAD